MPTLVAILDRIPGSTLPIAASMISIALSCVFVSLQTYRVREIHIAIRAVLPMWRNVHRLEFVFGMAQLAVLQRQFLEALYAAPFCSGLVAHMSSIISIRGVTNVAELAE
jgi:hypothetical protein